MCSGIAPDHFPARVIAISASLGIGQESKNRVHPDRLEKDRWTAARCESAVSFGSLLARQFNKQRFLLFCRGVGEN